MEGWRPLLSSPVISWRKTTGQHAYMPCSLTPVGFQYQAIAVFQCCLPLFIRRRLPRCGHFEAVLHGLYIRCLNFAVPVTRAPHQTRFRWMAGPCRTALVPAGFLTPFHDGLRRQSQATTLCLAHINPSPFPFIPFPHR